MSDHQAPKRSGDLTDEQAALLLKSFTETLTEAGQIAARLSQYVTVGVRDWESYERLLDHWARQGLEMVHAGRGAIRPELGRISAQLIEQAAGLTGGEGGMREHLHQQIAAAVLSTVWYAGEHHLIEAADWPGDLPEVVLAAVRQAPGLTNDPMKNLHGTGRPGR
ncbi:hypothetical protein [Streptomyces sp. CdTB01]|uniref:hypothetical protein n=1 Tax=Streptomyces sp. CdTB01 TaxID=1725411 RepID=UPI00073A5419|nr:hypothetical protein [Streptomyces sp. CdTB01]ALV39222.1 hypothetical protein AS200_44815 [Streptomyces sp. CdTB01]